MIHELNIIAFMV